MVILHLSSLPIYISSRIRITINLLCLALAHQSSNLEEIKIHKNLIDDIVYIVTALTAQSCTTFSTVYLSCSCLVHWVIALGYPIPWLGRQERGGEMGTEERRERKIQKGRDQSGRENKNHSVV